MNFEVPSYILRDLKNISLLYVTVRGSVIHSRQEVK